MTEEQKYAEVLKALGEMLATKDVTINCNQVTIADLKMQIRELTEKLALAEKEKERRSFMPAGEGGAA